MQHKDLITDRIVRKGHYVEILKQHNKTLPWKLKLGHRWVFQTDDECKHTSPFCYKMSQEQQSFCLVCPSQRPCLSIKANVCASKVNFFVLRNGPISQQITVRSLGGTPTFFDPSHSAKKTKQSNTNKQCWLSYKEIVKYFTLVVKASKM